MVTPLMKTNLSSLFNQPIMFDANIFMVGIEDRAVDKFCSFDNIRVVYLDAILSCFKDIYIHQEVYNELDDECRSYLDNYVGKNITIVSEGDLYESDPKYNDIFNKIANHDLVRYVRGNSKDRGEVYSLAYAAYNGINYFSSREIMVDIVAQDIEELENVDILTFDVIILTAYYFHYKNGIKDYNIALKSFYKKYCSDVIKRHKLPKTFSEYITEVQKYI